jgi:hypothetical protein
MQWVLLNKSPGSFGFSIEFEREFLRRFPRKQSILESAERSPTVWSRTDPDLVALALEFGPQINCDYSNISCTYQIFPQLVDYATIVNHGGIEEVHIDYGRVFLEILDEIMSTNDVDTIRPRYVQTKTLCESQRVFSQQ